MATPKIKHLRSTAAMSAWQTECGLSTMIAGTYAVRDEARCTCPDCPRIRRERHERNMRTDPDYRRFHETVAAFAGLGIKVGRHGRISMSIAEAGKVLRRLRVAKKSRAGGTPEKGGADGR